MKEQMVLVTIKDINGKLHYKLCRDMATAKYLFPSNEKRCISIVEPKEKDKEIIEKFYK
jgi:hypothetical protein